MLGVRKSYRVRVRPGRPLQVAANAQDSASFCTGDSRGLCFDVPTRLRRSHWSPQHPGRLGKTTVQTASGSHTERVATKIVALVQKTSKHAARGHEASLLTVTKPPAANLPRVRRSDVIFDSSRARAKPQRDAADATQHQHTTPNHEVRPRAHARALHPDARNPETGHERR